MWNLLASQRTEEVFCMLTKKPVATMGAKGIFGALGPLSESDELNTQSLFRQCTLSTLTTMD
tara:strand:+ start:441 stop:626 length:186 start_codon:yes stop_codon:yes gene_type:complete|eukprot:GDKH01013852.1.p2 GENE.GDKH01013852.1~~GDKH01013852.1.p2  ORF type:complete len:62 (-),score=9.58 GDKH01013852.1:145-330(-)